MREKKKEGKTAFDGRLVRSFVRSFVTVIYRFDIFVWPMTVPYEIYSLSYVKNRLPSELLFFFPLTHIKIMITNVQRPAPYTREQYFNLYFGDKFNISFYEGRYTSWFF